MRIFVYEFVTGGGWLGYSDELPPQSLLSEGAAMRTAVAADFAALSGATVDALHDARLPEWSLSGVSQHPVSSSADERELLGQLAASTDWTVLIAPEFDDQLLTRTRAVERAGGRLLSPSSQVVALASAKHATAEYLARHGIATPRGVTIAPGDRLPSDFPLPAVLKPGDGAGSLGIEWITDSLDARVVDRSARLETFHPGASVSVACLCGPIAIVPLVPCRQRLVGGGDFSYLGGSLPIEPELATRARRLAQRTAGALPETNGYLGIDLVLGSDPTGSGDVVIEVNPRLTTSYVGLRALSRVNLAAAMIAVAQGQEVELCWNASPIHFSSSGICGECPTNQ